MKALSIRQPWAWAIIRGFKPWENRTWNSNFCGMFAVHASLTFDHGGYRWICANHKMLGIDVADIPAAADFVRGEIVGFATMDGCVKVDKYNEKEPWLFGPVGFKISEPMELIEPIKCKGALNFFYLPKRVDKMVTAMLCADPDLIFKR